MMKSKLDRLKLEYTAVLAAQTTQVQAAQSYDNGGTPLIETSPISIGHSPTVLFPPTNFSGGGQFSPVNQVRRMVPKCLPITSTAFALREQICQLVTEYESESLAVGYRRIFAVSQAVSMHFLYNQAYICF
jgi:hypothetical protein